MSSKIVKTFIYEGLGFPVKLDNVEMKLIRGKYLPNLDIELISDKVIKDLVWQKTKLTGNQIRFIRDYFSQSLRDFALIVNESHAAIKKWEDFKNKPTKMDPNIEKTIRLYIYDKVCIKSSADKRNFYDKYRVITNIISQQKSIKNNLEVSA